MCVLPPRVAYRFAGGGALCCLAVVVCVNPAARQWQHIMLVLEGEECRKGCQK